MTEERSISRAQFRNVLQCEKRLWLSAHHGIPPSNTGKARRPSLYQWNFNDLRALARDHFSRIHEAIAISDASHEDALIQTQRALDKGAYCLFNARVANNSASARIDILVKSGDTWHAYELRPVVSLKPKHFEQAAFNYRVLETHFGSVRYHVLYIRKKSRMSEVDSLWDLIREDDITPEVRSLQVEVSAEVAKALDVLRMPEAPDVAIGPHCSRPHECPFKKNCWGNHLSERSVLQLSHANGAEWELYASGYHEFDEVPAGWPLTPKQQQQVNAWKTGDFYVDRAALSHWMQQLKWPVFCLDFETFNPLFSPEPESKPLNHIPFQFSVCQLTAPDAEGLFSSFLAKARDDYMEELIQELLKATEGEGTILAYGAEHERKMIRQLMRWYPKYLPQLEQRLQRISDMIVPFRNRWLYVAEMNGSASIKNVIPAFSPEMSFNRLEVENGKAAAEQFEQMTRSNDETLRSALEQELIAYSTHDVDSMVKLLQIIHAQAMRNQ